MSIAIANRIRIMNMREYKKLWKYEEEQKNEKKKKRSIVWIFKREIKI